VETASGPLKPADCARSRAEQNAEGRVARKARLAHRLAPLETPVSAAPADLLLIVGFMRLAAASAALGLSVSG
jgi:hypothetical protein